MDPRDPWFHVGVHRITQCVYRDDARFVAISCIFRPISETSWYWILGGLHNELNELSLITLTWAAARALSSASSLSHGGLTQAAGTTHYNMLENFFILLCFLTDQREHTGELSTISIIATRWFTSSRSWGQVARKDARTIRVFRCIRCVIFAG